MTCPNCAAKIPIHVRHCPSCQSDVGFPNVRAAQTEIEKRALQKRYVDAVVSTEARACHGVLEQFGRKVLESKAVMCRSLSILHELISIDNRLYVSFHKEVSAGLRLPKDDVWESARPAVEAALFPHYFGEINFACLSLDYTGLTNYGAYSVTLKSKMIGHRASTFEENPFKFMERHRIVTGKPIPSGYRASWDDRGSLAMAKLHSKLDPGTKDTDFPQILLMPGSGTAEDEFIEVHIFGPIHPSAFERIVGPVPTNKPDKVLWRSLKKKCEHFGIIVEER